jgi:hypothetical protein
MLVQQPSVRRTAGLAQRAALNKIIAFAAVAAESARLCESVQRTVCGCLLSMPHACQWLFSNQNATDDVVLQTYIVCLNLLLLLATLLFISIWSVPHAVQFLYTR